MPPALAPLDEQRLQQALALAGSAVGLTEPNPRVGCVMADRSGRIVGQGHTQQAGGPHAEVMALRDAAAAGHPVAGGTAWVTLEPCAHHGRTGPCADALVAAGLARVVVAMTDPFAQVAGRGIARLRDAGIAVDLAPAGPLVDAALALNIGFFSRILRQRPWVRVKAAASLDGRTALPDGRSQWITGEAARTDGHAWRRRAGAVLTGIGTVRGDNPRLDVRLVHTERQPLRVVLDSTLSIASDSRVLAPPGQALVVGVAPATGADAALAERRQRLLDAGAQVLLLPAAAAPAPARVDVPALLAALAERGVNELHVEAGATLNGALLAADAVDEWLIYLAPKLIGTGRGIADGAPLAQLADAPGLHLLSCTPIGPDLCVRALSAGASQRFAQGDWLTQPPKATG